jgi:tryptophan synthase alpha subunit
MVFVLVVFVIALLYFAQNKAKEATATAVAQAEAKAAQADAKAAGLAGFVVPDLPVEESDELEAACRDSGLALVRLVTPTTPPERAEAIARRSTGFLYCVSVAGVTGARTDLPAGLIDRVKWLRTQTDVPILVGFGISAGTCRSMTNTRPPATAGPE